MAEHAFKAVLYRSTSDLMVCTKFSLLFTAMGKKQSHTAIACPCIDSIDWFIVVVRYSQLARGMEKTGSQCTCTLQKESNVKKKQIYRPKTPDIWY